ncbi:MAG: hypothetical protein HY569_02820 [Candidatus Magasanikbacteria bacterium]|nr:hypothetical protein [Candidatus Magasanikbacteria bacterium]
MVSSLTEIVDQKQPSITEWLEQAGITNVAELREEDNNKRDRLEILYQTLGIQYDRPTKLSARDIADRSKNFLDVLRTQGKEKCALRLVPIKAGLPKLRVRGKTLIENLKWFAGLGINPDDYKAEIIPHCDNTAYSAIFVINDSGIWGEIAPGAHWQLTQGLYNQPPIVFRYDFLDWFFSSTNTTVINIIKKAINLLRVAKEKQGTLKDSLSSEFTKQDYLKGYFEFVVWPEIGISFIDYNRILYKMVGEFPPLTQVAKEDVLSGINASPGKTNGKIKIVIDPTQIAFENGEILVCLMTTIDYLPLMRKAAGIITEQGNILSHAAIISRELKKPCLVGVKNAMKLLKNGQEVELDANAGVIRVIENCKL